MPTMSASGQPSGGIPDEVSRGIQALPFEYPLIGTIGKTLLKALQACTVKELKEAITRTETALLNIDSSGGSSALQVSECLDAAQALYLLLRAAIQGAHADKNLTPPTKIGLNSLEAALTSISRASFMTTQEARENLPPVSLKQVMQDIAEYYSIKYDPAGRSLLESLQLSGQLLFQRASRKGEVSFIQQVGEKCTEAMSTVTTDDRAREEIASIRNATLQFVIGKITYNEGFSGSNSTLRTLLVAAKALNAPAESSASKPLFPNTIQSAIRLVSDFCSKHEIMIPPSLAQFKSDSEQAEDRLKQFNNFL